MGSPLAEVLAEPEDQRLLRALAGRVAADFGPRYFLPRARAHEPLEELWSAAADAGLVGLHLPEEHGGGGAGISELAVAAEELAAHGCPLLMVVVSGAICGTVIADHGTADQQDAWLPDLADGSAIWAFAVTEPDAGSNTRALRTTARRQGDGWVVDGAKHYITGLDVADRVLVVTRVVDSGGRAGEEFALFSLPTDAEGLSASVIPVAVTAPERQFAVFLDEVAAEDGALVGGRTVGLGDLFGGLNPERILSAAVANGLSRYALGAAVSYARERAVWGVPIGAHQGLAHPLAECFIAVEHARHLTAAAADAHDGGRQAGLAANIAKLSAADAALRSIDQAMQVLGGHGLSEEYALAEYWSIARFLKTAPVTREMILNHVAERGLGLPRSY